MQNASVIIVNYNCSLTLEKCISSILNSKRVGELLLVDNASTDGSLHLLDKYAADSRLRIICLKKNIGLPGARNLAAAEVRNPYIAFADADSIVDPNWLEIPCFILESQKEIGAVQCDVITSSHSEKIAHASARILVDGCSWIQTPEGRSICHWRWLFPIGAGFVVRRDVWDHVKGFDADFFVGNDDVEFGLRLWLSGYQVVVSSEGTVYHEGGQLRSKKSIAPIFLFYEIKSFLTLWARDLEGWTIVKQVLPFSLLYPFMAVWRGGIEGVKGLVSFLRSLNLTIARRNEVQRLRRTPDSEIIPLMLVASIMPMQLLVRDFRLLCKNFSNRTGL